MSVPEQAPPSSLADGLAELARYDQWFAEADALAEQLKALQEQYQERLEQAPELAMRTTYLRVWIEGQKAAPVKRPARKR